MRHLAKSGHLQNRQCDGAESPRSKQILLFGEKRRRKQLRANALAKRGGFGFSKTAGEGRAANKEGFPFSQDAGVPFNLTSLIGMRFV